MKRFDRSSPDHLLMSIAAEFARLDGEIAYLRQALTSMGSAQAEATQPPAKASSSPPKVPSPQPVEVPLPPAMTIIDANARFCGAKGFYDLEHDKSGRPFRWTGPDAEFSFTFAIDRSGPVPCALHFDRLFAEDVASVKGLGAFADGHLIAVDVTRTAAHEAHEHVAKCELPARSARGDTVLKFVCPSMGLPRDRGFDDPRRLGVLFRLLEVGSVVHKAAQP